MSIVDKGYTDGGPNPYYIGDCKYCALKAGRIDELEKCGEHRQGIIEIQESHIAELEAELAEQAAQLEAEKIRSAAILESIDGCAGKVAELKQQLAELREALTRIRDCDWVITLPDRMDAVRDMARAALQESDKAELGHNADKRIADCAQNLLVGRRPVIHKS